MFKKRRENIKREGVYPEKFEGFPFNKPREEVKAMAYSYTNKKGQTYYLHNKNVTLRGGRKQVIYFFAREVRSGSLDAVPAGYKVMETERTGMPVLKKS